MKQYCSSILSIQKMSLLVKNKPKTRAQVMHKEETRRNFIFIETKNLK